MAEEITQALTLHASQPRNSILRSITQVFDERSSSDRFWIGVIVAAALVVSLPLLAFGIPYGYDLGQHLRLAQAFRNGVLAGSFVPGWGALDNYGLGSIAVRIYPPILDQLWGIMSIVTGEFYFSILFTLTVMMIPGSIGIYFWAREFVDHKQAGLAALCYLIVPYHLMQVYQSGLLSEFAAAAVLPFCFLFATRVIEKAKASSVLGLAVSYALLILTHIPSIIIGSLALSVYCLTLIDWKKPLGQVFRLAVSVVLAASASSFFWLRVVTEFNWIKVTEAENYSGHYDYRQYLFPMFLSSTEDVYWGRLLWLGDIVIALTFVLAVPALIVFFSSKMEPRMRRWFRSLLFTSLFLLFILSSASRIIWEYAPLLHRIQFSWRFLVAASVVTTILFTLALPLLWKRFTSRQRLMGYVLAIFAGTILVVNLGEIVLPGAPLSRQEFASTYQDLNESEGCDCFWPRWANSNAFLNKEPVTAPGRSVEVAKWDAEARQFLVSGGEAATARVATFWYPYWAAEINGVATEILPDADGAILIPLPAGDADVRLSFVEPTFLQVAKYVSLATWIGLVVWLIVLRRRSRSAADLAAA